jgi:3-oxoacyl-[acyl-carrier protein] reductase
MRIGADTRALVTGASKGIGRALCEELARRGATVGMVARNEEDLRAAAEPIGGIPLAADVGDFTMIEQAAGEFAGKAGGIDLVIANAGIARYAPFADQDLSDAEQMVAINVLGMIYTVRAGLPHMLDKGSGHVVVISSGAGLRAFPGAAVYGATKAANRGFAEALRHELSGTGVSVSTVFPGEIATDARACPIGARAMTSCRSRRRLTRSSPASRPTRATSMCRARSGCSVSTASRRGWSIVCSPPSAAAVPRRAAIDRSDHHPIDWRDISS